MDNNNPLNTIFDLKKSQVESDLAISLNWRDLKGQLDPNFHNESYFEQFGNLAWSASPAFATLALIGGAWLYNLSMQFESQLMANSLQWEPYLGLLEKAV